MPAANDESCGASAFTEVATTCIDLSFARSCRRDDAFVILICWRVCARPAPDSDPVRRHGPERGSTRGGGRPRSFPSGPLPRRESGGPIGRRRPRRQSRTASVSTSQAMSPWPADRRAAANRAEDGRAAEPARPLGVDIASDVDVARHATRQSGGPIGRRTAAPAERAQRQASGRITSKRSDRRWSGRSRT